MFSPTRVWIAAALVYAVFFGWYTSFAGPLGADEIERYLGVLRESGADLDRVDLFRRFMETDTGDDFAMLNVIEMRATPEPVDGVPPGETADEVLGRYTEPFLGQALKSAAHPVLFGRAASDALDLWGIEGAGRWSNGGVVRYRSRRDLMDQIVYMTERGDDIHRFKIAAMAKTVAFPLDPWLHLGDPRLVFGMALALLAMGWHLRWSLRELRRARARA
jgi:hypothetical protein